MAAKRKILIIAPMTTHPANSGNTIMLWSRAKQFLEAGHEVHFYYIGIKRGFFYDERRIEQTKSFWKERFHSFLNYREDLYLAPVPPKSFLERIHLKFLFTTKSERFYTNDVDDFIDPKLIDSLRELQKEQRFDVAYVNYVFFSKLFAAFDDACLKVLDTHDIFGNRHKVFHDRGMKNGWFSIEPKSEIRGLLRADVIVAAQRNEENYLRSKIDKPIFTVGPMLDDPFTRAEFKQPETVLFMAYKNRSNIDAFEFFFHQVWHLIQSKQPRLRFLLAGSICGQIEVPDGVEAIGEVDSVAEAYEQADIVVNPTLIGTGIKIKTLEAMSYKKPLVTTSVGADGLEDGAGKAFLLADEANDFANAVGEIANSPESYKRFSDSAYAYYLEYNAACIARLHAAIAH